MEATFNTGISIDDSVNLIWKGVAEGLNSPKSKKRLYGLLQTGYEGLNGDKPAFDENQFQKSTVHYDGNIIRIDMPGKAVAHITPSEKYLTIGVCGVPENVSRPTIEAIAVECQKQYRNALPRDREMPSINLYPPKSKIAYKTI